MTNLPGQSATTPKRELDYLTIEQVAAELGRASRHTVQRLLRLDETFPRGTEVPHIKGTVWIRGDLDAWKEAKVEATRAENARRLEKLKPQTREVKRGR